ncbi:MAG: DUF4920 domain-containing protein [Crocinitomicaceae bacterium]|nr:DUF4920 domain-containing protein [Crocinitomicaceae bacterium]
MIFAVTSLMISCGGEEKKEEKKDNTENKEEAKAPAVMLRGADFDTSAVMSPNEMIAKMEGLDSLEGIVLRTEINECCQKKGCWMTLNMGDGNPDMRVWFKDYDFFVPLDASGTPVVVAGKAFIDTVSIADQKHILEDANASAEEIAAITEPKVELGFEATGVYLYGYNGEEAEGNEKK